MSDNLKYPVITISREYGAHGRTVAAIISEKLNIPYYDKDFVLKTVEATGYSASDVLHEGEQMSKVAKFLNDILSTSASYVSSYDRIHDMQAEVIKILAKEPCIIIGRSADSVLTEAGIPVLRIFLYADMDTKVDNLKRQFPDMNEAAIKKEIEKNDEQRRIYYKAYNNKELGDTKNYDLCFNTSVVDPKTVADIVCKLAMGE